MVLGGYRGFKLRGGCLTDHRLGISVVKHGLVMVVSISADCYGRLPVMSHYLHFGCRLVLNLTRRARQTRDQIFVMTLEHGERSCVWIRQ